MYRLKDDDLAVHTGIAALRNMVDDTQPEDQALVVAGWIKPDGTTVSSAQAIVDAMSWFPNEAGILVAGCGTLVKISEVSTKVAPGALLGCTGPTL